QALLVKQVDHPAQGRGLELDRLQDFLLGLDAGRRLEVLGEDGGGQGERERQQEEMARNHGSPFMMITVWPRFAETRSAAAGRQEERRMRLSVRADRGFVNREDADGDRKGTCEGRHPAGVKKPIS